MLASCFTLVILPAMSAMMFAVTLFLSFLAQSSGTNCDKSAVQTKSGTCIKQMTSNIGGGVCNAWNGYVCCLKDAFAGCNMDTQIDSMINTMKTTYSGMPGFADISSCGTTSCNGGSTGSSETLESNTSDTTWSLSFAPLLILLIKMIQ